MNKVAIMTDTVSFMSQEMADKHDIKLIPLPITVVTLHGGLGSRYFSWWSED